MKSLFLLLLICVGVCFLFPKNEEIRIRVISNSDSESDVLYKDKVVIFLKDKILIDENLTDKYFEANYKNIEDILNEEFDNICVKYENHTFINKTYNGSAVENKEYKTLLILIGDGLGSNWWGSVFDETLQYESDLEVEYQWYLKKEKRWIKCTK
jgi:hypothetical protein